MTSAGRQHERKGEYGSRGEKSLCESRREHTGPPGELLGKSPDIIDLACSGVVCCGARIEVVTNWLNLHGWRD